MTSKPPTEPVTIMSNGKTWKFNLPEEEIAKLEKMVGQKFDAPEKVVPPTVYVNRGETRTIAAMGKKSTAWIDVTVDQNGEIEVRQRIETPE